MKVKLKSTKKLKKYSRNLGGDMSEDLHYFISLTDGKLIPSNGDCNTAFIAVSKHVLEHGEEFLVVDHPNIITRNEYESTRELYERIN